MTPSYESEGLDADERVATAISHWAPRFTTNGVTFGDFDRVTDYLQRWDEWSAVATEHEQLGRDALAACPAHHVPLARDHGQARPSGPWQHAQRLVEEAGEAAQLLPEEGNHGCMNLAPFHRQTTADWAAEQPGAEVALAT